MTGGGRNALGALLLLPALVASAPAVARHRHVHLHPRFFDPYGFDGPVEPFFDNPPPSGLPPEAAPEIVPQLVPEPSPSPGPLPYPQGFVLDVPVYPRADDPPPPDPVHPAPLNRYREVANALAACWNPPAQFDDAPWRQVTLRVSFKRDGTVNGMPRIPYVHEGLTADARSDLTRSLMDALGRCTPLRLSPALGGAIAGQIFALRFIEQEPDR